MSAAGAAAAAAARRRREEEEEWMTPYSPQDLSEGWEFKILRSATGAFKDPATLQKYLAEEGQASWVLVEKFDNSRVRLKRPASARQHDGSLTFDAYRTSVGMTEVNLAVLIAGRIIGAIILLRGIVAVIVKSP